MKQGLLGIQMERSKWENYWQWGSVGAKRWYSTVRHTEGSLKGGGGVASQDAKQEEYPWESSKKNISKWVLRRSEQRKLYVADS